MSELKYYKLFHRASALISPEFISVVEFGTDDEIYCKSEADKVIAEKDKEIAELKSDIADLRDDKKLSDAILDERNAEITELKADYDEVRGRLQTANLIKDEQLAATRHANYKRCLAMAELAVEDDYSPWNMKWHKRWLELAEKFKPNNSTAQ